MNKVGEYVARLIKMIARDNCTYDVGYDIKYIYER